jgi:hypothetical protein
MRMTSVTKAAVRRLCLAAAVSAVAALSACGGSEAPAVAPPSTPVGAVTVPSTNEGQTPGKAAPNFQSLVEGQTAKPESRFTPCSLVTAQQATAIVGPIKELVEAPQGPSCVYQARDGSQFVTVSVQDVDFATLKPQLHGPKRVKVADETAYCGTYGQPTMYVPLAEGRVLSIAAPCNVAKKFAAKAIPRLP